jgi:hypothetical protein
MNSREPRRENSITTLQAPPAAHVTDADNFRAARDFLISDIEKQPDWTTYVSQELSQQRHGSTFRTIRYGFMSMYRRLFSVIFLVNLAVAISFAVTGKATIDRLAGAALGNLTASVVIRNDHMVNLLFRSFSSVPKSLPLWIRRYCAKIYSFGGIHSGCGVFSLIWLFWLTGVITRGYMSENNIVCPPYFPLVNFGN